MPETLVLCGGETVPSKRHGRVIELDVDPDAPLSRRIDFDTERISAALLDDLPDVVADAVELAAYVYCADRLERRKQSKNGAGIGSEWQRQFRFRVPVRRLDLWQQRKVQFALVDVLSFLSGDRFSFEFVETRKPMSLEPHLGFGDSNAQIIRPDKVMLFSGGLDSLAGAAREVIAGGERAILVAHQSANQIMPLQDSLAERINVKAPGRTFYAPVRVRRGSEQPREYSQRLRSFLFATLGLAYARMFRLRSVHFFENGITSFNLPIAEHVIGTRASRTTHPRVLSSYAKLFSLLLGEEIAFENTFLWQTKTDVVRTIAQHGCSGLIDLTTSCANIRQYSMTGLQCGTCSQCVERRVAMIAAGLDGSERPYAKDMFLGPIEDGRDLTMIEGHMLRANKLKSMSQHAFLANHGEAFRAFASMAGTPAEAAERTYLLHQRYGREFVDVVESHLATHTRIEKLRQISPQSLFGMLLPRMEPSSPFIDATEQEAPASIQTLKARTIVMAVDREREQIVFSDGPVLTGNAYRLLERLVDHKAKSDKFISPKMLAHQLDITEENLRQVINRLRERLQAEFSKATGFATHEQDVIETQSWRGYRLNPFVIVVPPEQLSRLMPMSRNSGEAVTTPADQR
jgi:7-cyano-7-deazaguanine synthase in queuosine biosynthesis/DNA-binding winged helix-turn-helix (wHTH) protein